MKCSSMSFSATSSLRAQPASSIQFFGLASTCMTPFLSRVCRFMAMATALSRFFMAPLALQLSNPRQPGNKSGWRPSPNPKPEGCRTYLGKSGIHAYDIQLQCLPGTAAPEWTDCSSETSQETTNAINQAWLLPRRAIGYGVEVLADDGCIALFLRLYQGQVGRVVAFHLDCAHGYAPATGKIGVTSTRCKKTSDSPP
ncbi:MAG: hypothetical protein [Caudoviricetes sp.]|nr:MAG: hypothetical protein [Caudoviricetes sp.]